MDCADKIFASQGKSCCGNKAKVFWMRSLRLFGQVVGSQGDYTRMLRDLASRCRYLGQERCFSVRNRSSFVCFIHISSFSFTDIGRRQFIWNNLSDKTVKKKLFWFYHQCFMMYTATLLDQQVRCFKLVGRGARKSAEVCGPTMSYEPLGARASKIRRTKTLQKEATATSRCMPHPLYIIPLTHQLYSPNTA